MEEYRGIDWMWTSLTIPHASGHTSGNRARRLYAPPSIVNNALSFHSRINKFPFDFSQIIESVSVHLDWPGSRFFRHSTTYWISPGGSRCPFAVPSRISAHPLAAFAHWVERSLLSAAIHSPSAP